MNSFKLIFCLVMVIGAGSAFGQNRDAGNPAQDACRSELAVNSPSPERIDEEISSIREAIRSGADVRITLADVYKLDQAALAHELRGNSLLHGDIVTDSLPESFADVESKMRELSGIVGEFDPANFQPARTPLGRITTAVMRLAGKQQHNIVARFQSREGQITEIIEGLERGRSGLVVDNELIDREIGGINTKLRLILSQDAVWKRRLAGLKSIEAELQQEIARLKQAGGDSRLQELQLADLQNQLILPATEVLRNLEERYDIFQALVVAKRGQQETNRQAIGTTASLIQTAQEVLPAIVSSAVTAGRTARVLNANRSARQLMRSGLDAVAGQMAENARTNIEAMKEGALGTEHVTAFRNKVLAVMSTIESGKAEQLRQLQEQREQRQRLLDSGAGQRMEALMRPAGVDRTDPNETAPNTSIVR